MKRKNSTGFFSTEPAPKRIKSPTNSDPISYDEKALLTKFNEFLDSIHGENFRFNFDGYCNGLSAYFLFHAVHGKLEEWQKDFNTVHATSPHSFESNQGLFYRLILNIIKLQGQTNFRQFHIHNIALIKDVNFISCKGITNINGSEKTFLDGFFTKKNPGLILHLYSDLERLTNYIEIGFDSQNSWYCQFNNEEKQDKFYFESKVKLLDFIGRNGANFLECDLNYPLIIGFIDKEYLQLNLADSAYFLLQDKPLFKMKNLLGHVKRDTGILLGSDRHAIAIYKDIHGKYTTFSNGDGVAMQMDALTIEYNIEKDPDVFSGHNNITLFRRSSQKLLEEKPSIYCAKMLERNAKYIAQLYEDSSDNDEEENSEDLGLKFQEKIEPLIRFCLSNDFDNTLCWHLKQFNKNILLDLSCFIPDLAELGFTKTLKYLVENHVEINESSDDDSALFLAYHHKNFQTFDFLLACDPQISKELFWLILKRKDEATMYKILQTTDMKKVDEWPENFIPKLLKFCKKTNNLELSNLVETILQPVIAEVVEVAQFRP